MLRHLDAAAARELAQAASQDPDAYRDELGERFEGYEPSPADERDPKACAALCRAVEWRARAERAIFEAVAQRASGYSWRTIGSLLGTSGEAARQRYGPRLAA